MPTSRAMRSAVSRAVAGQQYGRQTEALELCDRLGAGRLDGVADRQRRPRLAVPGDGDRAVAAADLDLVAVDDAAHARRPARCGSPRPRQLAHLAGRRARRSRARPDARTRPRPRPQGAGPRPRVAPFNSTTSTSSIRPSVIGAGLVEHDRPDPPRLLEHLGAADQDAELRATAGADHQRRRRREAERARAGDDQHRDGGRERVRGRARRTASQPASVSSESPITIGTKTAETRSARRWTGALPDCASSTSRAICASAVSAPTFVARTTSRPCVLTVAPATSLPGADLHGHGLARQQRLVDGRAALDDDAVSGDLLAGPDDEQVADDELVDRDEHLAAVAEHACLLRAELEQAPDRVARAAPAPAPPGSGRAGSASSPRRRPRSTCRCRARRRARSSTRATRRACRSR